MKQLQYGVQTNNKIIHKAEEWCKGRWGPRWEAVGNREGTWCVFWRGTNVENYPSSYQWWFETAEQQLLFALTWS